MVSLGPVSRPPDMLLALDEEYASILALLDPPAAVRRLLVNVPELSGVETAFTGEPDSENQMVLHRPVNLSEAVEGLAAPMSASLGGRVFAARRPVWTSDYRSASGITARFKTQAQAEGLVAVIGVPIIHQGSVQGVLYGANRIATEFSDRMVSALEDVAARMVTAQHVAECALHAAEVAVHEERRRLALNLHDTVGAALFTLRAGIQRLGDDPKLDALVRSRLSAIEQQAAEASAALRSSLHVLHAPPEQVALGVALSAHCRAFSDRTGIRTRVITLNELPPLPRAQMGALADTTREALLNIEKHAHAHAVAVSVFASRGGVAITISDDGVGLDPDYAQHEGLGLTAMTERVTQVGGTISVGPNDDEDYGVTVKAWVPA
jgi:signal transduction histidine kinase